MADAIGAHCVGPVAMKCDQAAIPLHVVTHVVSCFRLPPPQTNKSRALGALLGMVVGDALGAPLGGQDLGARCRFWDLGNVLSLHFEHFVIFCLCMFLL